MTSSPELGDLYIENLTHLREHFVCWQRFGDMPEGYVLGPRVALDPFLIQLVDPRPKAVAANAARRFLQRHLEIVVGLGKTAVSAL
jgi:hypothetical protein